VLGDVPWERRLEALRLKDLRDALDLGIEQEGGLVHSGLREFLVAGSGVAPKAAASGLNCEPPGVDCSLTRIASSATRLKRPARLLGP
jgi:hypothetical protein